LIVVELGPLAALFTLLIFMFSYISPSFLRSSPTIRALAHAPEETDVHTESLWEEAVRLCPDHNLGTVSNSLRPEGKSYSLPVKQSGDISNYRDFFALK
jgi:hypothetical protein